MRSAGSEYKTETQSNYQVPAAAAAASAPRQANNKRLFAPSFGGGDRAKPSQSNWFPPSFRTRKNVIDWDLFSIISFL